MIGKVVRKVRGKVLALGLEIGLKHLDRSLRNGEHGEDAMNAWKKLVAFMNGKKLWTGTVLLAIPAVAAAMATAMLEAGIDPLLAAKWTSWGSGSVLVVVGGVHKIVKWLDDLTPDEPVE